MKIRKATSRDRKKLTEFYVGLYPHWKKKVKNKKVPLSAGIKTIVLVAEIDKEVVGFCWANFVKFGLSKFGYIEDLFVDKKFRNKGIGTSLVKKAMKEMKKMKVNAVFVATGKKNKKSIKIYKSLGFKQDKNYWLWLYWTYKEKR
jgi:ribosomal protein S18 acetylase RimI-like enzyme